MALKNFRDGARSMSCYDCGQRDLRALLIIAVPACSRSLKGGRFLNGIVVSSVVYSA